jgi:formate dehydrogenase major subunit
VLSKTDRDYGTPPKSSAKLVTLEVDGREVRVPEGTSVLRAAVLADVAIPKLCATDSLEPFGS